MTAPPINLAVLKASRDAPDRAVFSNTPTIENTSVNPSTKNAEFRNTASRALAESTGRCCDTPNSLNKHLFIVHPNL